MRGYWEHLYHRKLGSSYLDKDIITEVRLRVSLSDSPPSAAALELITDGVDICNTKEFDYPELDIMQLHSLWSGSGGEYWDDSAVFEGDETDDLDDVADKGEHLLGQ